VWAIKKKRAKHYGITLNPAAYIEKLEVGEVQPWTPEQLQIALTRFPEHKARVIWFVSHTGLRCSDAARAKWTDIKDNILELRQYKTGDLVPVPILPRLELLLAEWRRRPNLCTGQRTPEVERNQQTYILTNARGKPWVTEDGSVGSISMIMNEMRKQVPELKGCTVHGLRKLYLKLRAEAGSTAFEVQASGGHRTLQMAELYTRAYDRRQAAIQAAAKVIEFEKSGHGLAVLDSLLDQQDEKDDAAELAGVGKP
jgi:integrase